MLLLTQGVTFGCVCRVCNSVKTEGQKVCEPQVLAQEASPIPWNLTRQSWNILIHGILPKKSTESVMKRKRDKGEVYVVFS